MNQSTQIFSIVFLCLKMITLISGQGDGGTPNTIPQGNAPSGQNNIPPENMANTGDTRAPPGNQEFQRNSHVPPDNTVPKDARAPEVQSGERNTVHGNVIHTENAHLSQNAQASQENIHIPQENIISPEQHYNPPEQHYNPPEQHFNPPEQHYNPPEQQHISPEQHYVPPDQHQVPNVPENQVPIQHQSFGDAQFSSTEQQQEIHSADQAPFAEPQQTADSTNQDEESNLTFKTAPPNEKLFVTKEGKVMKLKPLPSTTAPPPKLRKDRKNFNKTIIKRVGNRRPTHTEL